MFLKTRSLGRTILLNALLVVGTALAGLAIGSVTNPVGAQKSACENDRCSTVCAGSECEGECFDAPGSLRQCDMVGGICGSSGCNAT